jgi:hypothetical protein
MLVQRQLTASASVQLPSPALIASTESRVQRLLALPQFGDVATFTVNVSPIPRSELRSIFSSDPNSIRNALEHPSDLRAHGWGIATGGPVQFIDGECAQTESFRTVVTLYRDGELLAGARIDRNFLAWADTTDGRIHPLAFIEYVTNILKFYRLVLADARIAPQTLQIGVRFANLHRGNQVLSLPHGTVNNMGWTSGDKPAPVTEWSRTILVDASVFDVGRAAFLMLRDIYVWFGHPEEAIPYTTGIGDEKAIDITAISAIT